MEGNWVEPGPEGAAGGQGAQPDSERRAATGMLDSAKGDRRASPVMLNKISRLLVCCNLVPSVISRCPTGCRCTTSLQMGMFGLSWG
jgi:hypothetical protein